MTGNSWEMSESLSIDKISEPKVTIKKEKGVTTDINE